MHLKLIPFVKGARLVMADNRTEQAMVDTVKFARLVSQTYSRSSLTRKARDTIATYPVIFSGGIPVDDAVIIARALEAQYAALLVSVISANSDYDRGKYNNPSDYLKTFHNNSNIPSFMQGLDSQLPDGTTIGDCAVESAMTMQSLAHLIPKEIAVECFDGVDDRCNSRSLNHAYQPASHTQSIMQDIVDKVTKIHAPAMEVDVLERMNASTTGRDDLGSPTKGGTVRRTTRDVPLTDDQGNIVRDNRGRPVTNRVTEDDIIQRNPQVTGVQKVATVADRLTALEPTLINLQLMSHHGNAPVITHNIVMGVKVKCRVIPQDLIISNLSMATNNSRAIFKWIKWTEGDYHFLRDFVLGVDNAKETAVSNRDMKNWIGAIKRRKFSDMWSKLINGSPMPPLMTVVCTSYEVARVFEATGIDLNEAYNVIKLINQYYLLGFVIYEPENGKIRSIFHGDTSFSTTTVSGLKTKQQKDIDLTQYAQFIRAAGRM